MRIRPHTADFDWGIRLLLLAFCLFAFEACGKGEADSDDNKTGEADSTKVEKDGDKKKVEEGVPVKVSQVGVGPISDYVQHTSTIEAEEAIDVYAQMSGLVSEVLV